MYEAAYKMLGGDGNKMVSLDSTIIEIRNDITIQKFGQAITILETSRKHLALMVGLNIRSLQRKRLSNHLTSRQSEHILAIIQALAEGIECFGDKNTTLEWLHTRNLELGRNKPFFMMDTITGIEIVQEIISRHKYAKTAALWLPSLKTRGALPAI